MDSKSSKIPIKARDLSLTLPNLEEQGAYCDSPERRTIRAIHNSNVRLNRSLSERLDYKRRISLPPIPSFVGIYGSTSSANLLDNNKSTESRSNLVSSRQLFSNVENRNEEDVRLSNQSIPNLNDSIKDNINKSRESRSNLVSSSRQLLTNIDKNEEEVRLSNQSIPNLNDSIRDNKENVSSSSKRETSGGSSSKVNEVYSKIPTRVTNRFEKTNNKYCQKPTKSQNKNQTSDIRESNSVSKNKNDHQKKRSHERKDEKASSAKSEQFKHNHNHSNRRHPSGKENLPQQSKNRNGKDDRRCSMGVVPRTDNNQVVNQERLSLDINGAIANRRKVKGIRKCGNSNPISNLSNAGTSRNQQENVNVNNETWRDNAENVRQANNHGEEEQEVMLNENGRTPSLEAFFVNLQVPPLISPIDDEPEYIRDQNQDNEEQTKVELVRLLRIMRKITFVPELIQPFD